MKYKHRNIFFLLKSCYFSKKKTASQTSFLSVILSKLSVLVAKTKTPSGSVEAHTVKATAFSNNTWKCSKFYCQCNLASLSYSRVLTQQSVAFRQIHPLKWSNFQTSRSLQNMQNISTVWSSGWKGWERNGVLISLKMVKFPQLKLSSEFQLEGN